MNEAAPRPIAIGTDDEDTDEQGRRRRRLAAVRRHSGILSGAYRPDHPDRLREEWPE